MYSVSADYLTALAQPVHKYRLSGTVGTEAFTQSNIISGSLSISNKVSEGSEIKLGSVYTGELRATFTGLSISRGSWVGKTIRLSEGLQLADESFEDVPLGVFTIAEATHKADGVSVVAYDAMTAFDKSRNDLTDTGTAYDFLSLICQKCGVALGMTSADVAALTNGTETLSIYSENDIETWRDLLSWIAQTLCSVATINRDGELELRQYSDSSSATIDETHRFTGCSFSDFTTYYTGMSVVNIALRQTEYKSVTPDDGLTYNLGSNPLVQGDYELVQNIIDDFSTVQLVPFSAQMLGGAIYDLCDCLTFSGGIAAGAVCGVMGFTWKYNGAYSVSGFGSNPALATAKSKAEKDIEAIYNTIGEEINQMSVVQNSSAVTCGENTETSILTYNFEVTQEENTTMVDVSVVMTSSASETEANDVYTLSDIVAHLSFYVDGSEISVYSPEFIVDEGKDTMTFNYSLSGLSVGAHEFDVRLTVDGGSGSIAVGDVHEMLWGYGITFEVYVKGIQVTQMPTKTTFYVGQRLDYSGIEVNEIYNNGTMSDVTAESSYSPTSGSVATSEEVGTLNVDVSHDGFSTDFVISVRELAYSIIEGGEEYTIDVQESISPQIFMVGNDIYAIGLRVPFGGSYIRVIISKMIIDASGALSRDSANDISDHPITGQHYVCGCRVGNAWYSMFEQNATSNYFAIQRERLDGGTFMYQFYYLPSPSTQIKFFYLESYGEPYAYSIDGYIVFPKAWVKIGNLSTSIVSMAYCDVSTGVIYVVGEDTDDDILTYHRIMQSDGNNGGSGSVQNCMYPMRYFYDLNNGTLSIYEAHCGSSGVSKTLVGSMSTNLTSLSVGHCRQVHNSNILLLADYDERICGVYDADTNSYREFTFTIDTSDDAYKTVLNMGNIFWDDTKELFFLPEATTSKTYKLWFSTDLESWSVVEKLTTDEGVNDVFNLAKCGNYIISTWMEESTNVAYRGITLDFT